jgi:hypothetical protein
MDPDAPPSGPRTARGDERAVSGALAAATGPRLGPEQRLFVAWLAHLVRARLHLIDAYAATVADGADPAAARRDAESIRRLVRSLLGQLDELTGGPARGSRPPS